MSAEPHTKPLPHPGLCPDRYELIDAWRGLAALGVCVHHVTGILIGPYCVMLFFVISGYCIAASADACQRKGWGFKGFMWRRIRRIYPPYLLSVAFWAAMRLLKLKMGGQNDLLFRLNGDARPWTDWAENLTLTQWLNLLWHPKPYAATNPALFVAAYWSLCYEEQFYLVMGLMVLIAPFLRIGVLGMSCVLLGAGLVWNAVFPTISYGFFIEYWALFAFGVLVFYRLCRVRNAAWRRGVDIGLALVVCVSVYLRWFAGLKWPQSSGPDDEIRVVYQELALAAGFALLLIAMRSVSMWISERKLFLPLAALGHITFSLYLIHQFNLVLMQTIAYKVIKPLCHLPEPRYTIGVGWDWHGIWLWVWYAVQIAGHIALASVFWYFCERPFLNRPLTARPPSAPPPASSGPAESA
jgi:peptidoglycan/LPS O-acetylase OafA/YrhL